MKTFQRYDTYASRLLIMLVILTAFGSCKKDNNEISKEAPVISKIRAIAPAPNDSTLTRVLPGQLVVIQGNNFLGVNAVYFNGVSATFNAALVAKDNLVVTVPAPDFSNQVKGQENTIRLVTNAGETIFTMPLLPPPPVITSLDYEYRAPGEVLTIYGEYLYLITGISFTGGEGTNIQATKEGTSVKVTIPAGASTGNILLTTEGGKTTYVSYNDRVTGMFANFDDVNPFQWWSGILTGDASLYPGATGSYIRMAFNNVGINDEAWYTEGRSIPMDNGQWIPAANLGDPVDDWTLKFDIYVKEPWKTGALLVRTDGYDYMARYDPWKTEEGKSFTTAEWITVSMPFSKFKKAAAGHQGTGEAIPNLTTLLGTTGKKDMVFMFYNDSSTPIAKFDAAVDNIRIVKIK